MKTHLIKSKIVLSVFTIFSLVISGFAGFVSRANAAMVPGGAVGPIVAAGIGKSLPAWYMDQNGLALEIMEAADGFGVSAPVAPGNAFSAELGFADEGFYWTADAAPANPNGVGITVLAMEAAFLGGTVDGGGAVFGRIRHRYDVAVPGTYTVRHPFGNNTYVVDVVGPGPEINDTSDIGCFPTLGVLSCNPNTPPGNPNNYSLALNSGIGPFLTWDTFDTNPILSDPALVNPARPGKRYVGNPLQDHAIKGSPVGQNFLRVEGPAGAFGAASFIETNLFSVTGRIAVIDTIPPVINVTPMSAALGATNVVVSVNITDNLGVRSAKIDLGPLGNTLTAAINNANEVPPTGSAAAGSGTFTIDTAANTLSFNINAAGLSSPVSHVHIHRGAANANGPMLFDAGSALPASGVWNYPEVEEANILSGNTYVQIHTLLFDNPLNLAGGEIRGQILPQSNIVDMSLVTLPNTNGIWSALIPGINRLGIFNLPITASDGSQSVTTNLVLTVNQLASVGVTPVSATLLGTSTQQLTASPLDNNGTAFVGATVTWSSSNPAAAAVSNTGLVTGVAPGSAIITATAVSGATTVTGTSSITVLSAAPVFTSVAVTPAVSSISLNSPVLTKQLAASALDQFGNAMVPQPAFAWTSSAPLVATVSPATGLVTAVATGTATITATSGVISGTATVNVVTDPQVLTSVSLTPAPSTVVRGTTTQLTGTGLDQFGGAMVPQPVITFVSSNPAVATVNATGLVTGVATGTATITAQSGALSATSVLTVTAAPQVLTSISITPTPANVVASGTRQLTAKALDQFGVPMVPQPAFAWSSSNPVIVAVNATGLLTAGTATGTAIITATSGAVSATTTANVVTDTTAPVITINGANPASVTVGSAYVDAGATAVDAVDGPVTVNSTNTVNTAVAGSYAVTYTATDATGNVATAVRTVNVSAPSGGGGGGGGGGGVPLPTIVTAVNAPLVLMPSQIGRLEQTLDDGLKVVVNVPDGAIAAKTTFKVTRGQLTDLTETEKSDKLRPVEHSLFNLTATNEAGQPVTSFAKTLAITMSGVELPNDVPNLGVYYFNASSQEWVLIPGALFNLSSKTFSFNPSHLTLFGIFRAPGLPSVIQPKQKIEKDKKDEDKRDDDKKQVLGVKIFADGTLIRTADRKIFVIVDNGFKRRVATLEELRNLGKKAIVNVSDATFNQIPFSTGKVLGAKIFKDGSLIRGRDGKIFVIEKGEKRHIATLVELKKFSRVKIESVDDNTLNSIKTKIEVRLLRGRDGKIFAVENNEKRHIRSLAELRSFGKVKIESADDNTLNKIRNKG